MKKFLYVFGRENRDALLNANYTLLISNERSDIYVFANKVDLTFDFSTIRFAYSDTLIF